MKIKPAFPACVFAVAAELGNQALHESNSPRNVLQPLVEQWQIDSRQCLMVSEPDSDAASFASVAICSSDRLNKDFLHHKVCLAGCVTQQR